MGKKLLLLGLLAGLVMPVLWAADPVEGYWKSMDEKTGLATAYWKIYQRGGQLFGDIVKLVDKPQDTVATAVKPSYRGFPVVGVVNQMKVVGTPWIYGLKMRNAGQWDGGTIIDPATGDSYQCKITYRKADGRRFTVDTLEMRGEIGLGIGRSQFWVRATEAEVK